MENITVSDIAVFLGLVAGIITSIGIITLPIQKMLKNTIRNEIEPINKSINNLDVSQCKNFLVRYLKDVEQNNKLDQVEIERAYEIYDHYTNDLKQNSYIHKRWEELEVKNERKNRKTN